MASNAVEKRYAAIGALVERYLPKATEYTLPEGTKAVDIAADIRDLSGLGRTDRWKGTVEQWASMVEERPEDIKHIEWAIRQGCVYAGYAAD
jgi:hypothetical protein